MIRTIAFDADDTLWHNETHFQGAQAAFRDLLSPHHDASGIDARLHDTEMRNLGRFGYGAKGFILSMLETALELSEGRLSGAETRRILDLGMALIDMPVEPLPGVRDALERLRGRLDLMVITKGDLFDQEAKLARSGLGGYFRHVEVVSEKDEPTYRTILARQGIAPEQFLMVGNSVKSDILPVVAVGGKAVHIPYEVTWSHERVPHASGNSHGYQELAHIGELPALLAKEFGL